MIALTLLLIGDEPLDPYRGFTCFGGWQPRAEYPDEHLLSDRADPLVLTGCLDLTREGVLSVVLRNTDPP